jgi:hypothetical protein
MAYFFDKIKAVTNVGSQNQTITFNNGSVPTFQAGSSNYGSLVTTGITGGNQDNLDILRTFRFVNGFSSIGTATLGNIALSGRINNLSLVSPSNRTLTFYASLSVGLESNSSPITIVNYSTNTAGISLYGSLDVGSTTGGTGKITIRSNNSVQKFLTLDRSLTIEAANANTIVYNASNTSLGSVSSPTLNGEFILSQKRTGGVVQTPT